MSANRFLYRNVNDVIRFSASRAPGWRTANGDGRRLAVAGLLCLGLSLGLVGCGRDDADDVVRRTPLPADTLFQVAEDEVSSLDPHLVSTVTEARVINDLFEGLTDQGPDGAVVPGLALHWQPDATGRNWTFTLAPGLSFSDGTPLDAAAVVASFRRLMDPRTAAPYASLLYMISNARPVAEGKAPVASLCVAAADARTVRFTLDQPNPAFPEILTHSTGAIVPVAAIDRLGPAWLKAGSFVGSGPFVLRRWILQDRLEVDRNPRYAHAADVRLRRVVYYPIADDNTAVRRFRAGEVDIVNDFPAQQHDLLRAKMGRRVRVHDYIGSYYIYLNTLRPPFSDERVRRALDMSFDREAIVTHVLRMGQKPAYSVVPPYVSGHGRAVLPDWAAWPVARRQAEARRLLAAAGYGPDRPLAFELRYNTDEMHKRVGLTLTQMWKPLGVRVSLYNSESSAHFNAMRARDFMAARGGWIADYDAPENFLFLFESATGAMNYTGYANPRFDRLMAQARAEPDAAARMAKFRAAEALLVNAAPVLPIYFYVSKSLVSSEVEGWTDNIMNVHSNRFLRVRRSRGMP